MTPRRWLITVVMAVALWPTPGARADEPPAPAEETPPAPASDTSPAPAPASASAGPVLPASGLPAGLPAAPPPAPPADDTPPAATPSADDLATLALARQEETIEVWGERPSKPFDRDTELRVTGVELGRRGVRDLAQALEYVPEVNIRNAGRGGRQIDIRGARKDSVKVFIDGIPVSDPYRGNVDLSSIPVTDIVEVRISTSPASPIDGTGGPGGVIEVHTRDAIGARLLGVRAEASTLPQALASVSGRAMLSRHLALRVSATGDLGRRDLAVVMPDGSPATLDEGRRTGNGALRLEYRDGVRRVALDVSAGAESYVVPPSETETSQIVVVDEASGVRLGVAGDDEAAGLRLQVRGYGTLGRRRTSFYSDATLATTTSSEDVTATTAGSMFLANRPLLGDRLELIGSAAIDTEAGEILGSGTTRGRATISALAGGFKLEQALASPDRLRVDGALGVAIPIDIGASPWPEGKLAGKVSFLGVLGARVVAGYKGRLPTLRDRFDAQDGNAALGPEKALYGEAGVTVERNACVTLDVSGYVRRSNGLIRYSPVEMQLVNLGEITFRGVDVRYTIGPYWPVRAGGSVSLLEVTAPDGGDSDIDRLPGQRGDVWVAGDLGQRGGALLRLRYIGEMLDRGITLPDYWLVEVSGYLHVTDDLSVSVRVDNALDARYLDRAGGVMGLGRVFLFGLQGTWEARPDE